MTTGRLGLGLVGLEGDALGSSALLARDRDNQLFLGLGRRRVRVETACRTFDCLDFGDGCDYLAMALAWDVGGRKILVERQGTYWRALPRARARFPGKFPFRKTPHRTVSSLTKRDTLTLFDWDCCACSSCCGAGLCLLLLMTLGGISKQILTIFFMSTHEDQWFCAKRYLILGSITS